MFEEFASPDEFIIQTVLERRAYEIREYMRTYRSVQRKKPAVRAAERKRWNTYDKKRRASDPVYREARRAGTRERMRRLRAARRLTR